MFRRVSCYQTPVDNPSSHNPPLPCLLPSPMLDRTWPLPCLRIQITLRTAPVAAGTTEVDGDTIERPETAGVPTALAGLVALMCEGLLPTSRRHRQIGQPRCGAENSWPSSGLSVCRIWRDEGVCSHEAVERGGGEQCDGCVGVGVPATCVVVHLAGL